MAWYSIYKNISKSDFERIKSKLILIEKISSPLMQMNGFYLNRINYDEGLDLDYISEAGNFKGNIGVTYDESNSAIETPIFNFYILKTYDANGQRFYKKEQLGQLCSLEEVEKDFIELFKKCIHIYNSFQREDLTESIELTK